MSFTAKQKINISATNDNSRITSAMVPEKDKDFVFLAAGANKNFAIELQDSSLY